MPKKGEVILDSGDECLVRLVSNEEIATRRAVRTKEQRRADRLDAKWLRRLNRACKRAEPHWAHPDDIEAVADEVLCKWLRRAVRFGDELVVLEKLYKLPDTRD